MNQRLLALALVAAAGCRGIKGPIGQRRAVPPQHGGTMQLADYNDVRNLDPAVEFNVSTNPIHQLLFTTLVDYDREGRLVPLLAERFDLSSDGLRVSFKLRQGALFHDGEEITADDVKRSIERALDHDTPCPVPSFYASIVGYGPFHDGVKNEAGDLAFAPHLDGVVVDGRYTVHIDLAEADATFLPAMTLYVVAPVCKSGGTKYVREWSLHACGAGPFRLEEWQVSREVTLARHAGYFEPGLPYLERIRFYELMLPLAQRFKFEDGDLDHIRQLSAPDLLFYRNDPRWKPFAQWEPPKEVAGIFFNTQMKPFDNVELRRAFAAAIDWPRAISVRPELMLATQLVPPAVPSHDPTFRGQTHDVAAALEHMKNAGYPYDPSSKAGGYPEPVVYVGPSNSIITDDVAVIVQQQIARIGIRMEIRQVSLPAHYAEVGRRGRVQLGYAGWSMDYPDPSDFFEPTLSSDAIQDEQSQNYAFYSNPELDSLLKKAHRELDTGARLALYRRAEEIVRDDVPWAIGFYQRWYEIVQPYVHDYKVDAKHTIDLRYVWIDSSERRQAARFRGRDALALLRPWGRP